MDAGKNGGWYAQKKRNRVYERLWMSFQFRVEDEYCFGDNLVGHYQTAVDELPPENTAR
eukprot:CAMPEP_0119025630 /NCGR_PEP_ID=MMETSP1176-20130426/34057_1 /TAXON_ID=265551 /ORGANISM="Synedropsis recta cf, Strain CCMP1620" /LENGTH=58 /DNA_ID=CAMNT_0006981197 /DNA_START=39 /DNA_END=212 /DNA_ORIENTATION=+